MLLLFSWKRWWLNILEELADMAVMYLGLPTTS